MSRKIASIFDNKDNEDHEHEGQAFFAGGSEHSGQQILGPDRPASGIVENLLSDARRHAATNLTPTNQTLPVTFWRNGFTVGDDSELRDYASNAQFLESLRKGEVPPELASRVQGGMIDVKLDNKAFQDYQPEQKKQAFAGEGHRLGAPAPSVVPESSSAGQSAPASSDASGSGLSKEEIRLKRLARFESNKNKP